METLVHQTHHTKETVSRTLVKTITYRAFVIMLDFTTVYLFTKQIKIALGFTITSNIYTTVAYFVHERVWDRIKWGKNIFRSAEAGK